MPPSLPYNESHRCVAVHPSVLNGRHAAWHYMAVVYMSEMQHLPTPDSLETTGNFNPSDPPKLFFRFRPSTSSPAWGASRAEWTFFPLSTEQVESRIYSSHGLFHKDLLYSIVTWNMLRRGKAIWFCHRPVNGIFAGELILLPLSWTHSVSFHQFFVVRHVESPVRQRSQCISRRSG